MDQFSTQSPPALPAPHKNRRVATSTLSMLVSVAIHTGLIAIAAAIVWRTAVTPHPASGVLTFETPGDAPLTLGAGTSSITPSPHTRPPAHEVIIEPTPASALVPADAPQPLRGLTSNPDPAAPSPADSPSGAPAPASSLGSLLGAEGSVDDRTNAAAAGASDGPAAVTFAGLGASGVKSVVYVVDCSGPMVTSLPMVIAELERSISHLSPTQKFGVVIFRRTGETGGGAESFAPVLVRPTASARKLLHEWLSRIEPTGRSSPLAGLEAALAVNPDAVFLLSRSIQRSGGGVWETGLEATMARLEQINPAAADGKRPALIQTIQFLDEDPSGIMQAIGSQHGGGQGYRVVRGRQDLESDKPAKPEP